MYLKYKEAPTWSYFNSGPSSGPLLRVFSCTDSKRGIVLFDNNILKHREEMQQNWEFISDISKYEIQ